VALKALKIEGSIPSTHPKTTKVENPKLQ